MKKRYTYDDLFVIADMYKAGCKAEEIAQRLKRTTGAIQFKIHQMRHDGTLEALAGE
ncbi:hypothetical protein PPK15_gp69 [Bacillus phage 000TH010]|uniref:Uncharacterized protein n=1 Tax=Bacillus phage 000TH010 TaxID=2601652 RepID=A0A5P8PHS9_9CAUD|nr:hypothetical protein PPK15_gp69 [Bacillus phage 000TH010]QFR56282.1 hypothetical protein 000TH010_69 [Bacillus phage 000TH010]